jgi:hypothetical protein
MICHFDPKFAVIVEPLKRAIIRVVAANETRLEHKLDRFPCTYVNMVLMKACVLWYLRDLGPPTNILESLFKSAMVS